jgi:uncharacterized protein YbjT (DUF2867 family)
MKIVVIGGTGLIGSKVVASLTEHGYEAIAASPKLGVNTITGEGLVEAVGGASVVIDVSNSPNFEYATALEFFERSTHNLLAAEAVAHVGHHVALSVVGTSTLARASDPETTTAGYFRAKQTQEDLIAASGIPYSIVHATQFFEFIKSIADTQAFYGVVRVPPVQFQPMAADDIASLVGRTAAGSPANGIVEIGGPQRFRFDEPLRRVLSAVGDRREVVTDPEARYFGIPVGEVTLVPAEDAVLGSTRLDDWISQSVALQPVVA